VPGALRQQHPPAAEPAACGRDGAGWLMPRLAEQDARRLLGSAPVARLATVTPDGSPHVVPVTFAVHGDMIYTAVDAKPKSTRRLRRLENIRLIPGAAVLADRYDDDWAALWWVRADGRACVIDDPGQMAMPVRLLAQRYWQYRDQPPAGPVIAISVGRWTGWTARQAASAEAGQS
jgi:PPOX class probable F420-dependent enzyme